MKPEEAIEFLNTDDYESKGYNDAVIMAIEALKEQRTHGECGTCKHFVKGGLDGKTYVCEHPCIEREDYYDYACLEVEEKDFCSYYENYESKEGGKLENDRRGIPGIQEEDEKAE